MKTEIIDKLGNGEAVTIGDCVVTERMMVDFENLQSSNGYGWKLFNKLRSLTMSIVFDNSYQDVYTKIEHLQTLVEFEDLLYHIVEE
jgi:hypothetical protein